MKAYAARLGIRMAVLLLSFAVGLPVSAATDSKLAPLSKYVEELEKRDPPDMSQVAYVGARSAALYTALSGIIEQNARDDKQREIAEKILRVGYVYFQVSQYVNLTANNMSAEKAKSQMKLLIDEYTAMMAESKQLNNEFVSPAVQADMEAAKKVFKLYEGMAADIQRILEAK